MGSPPPLTLLTLRTATHPLTSLTRQVPCWLRPRDRTRSPEVLNNASRPTTLPLRIPPRISITQADADRFFPARPRFLPRVLLPLPVPPRTLTNPSLPGLALQLRGGEWRVAGPHPAGSAEPGPHPAHLLPPGPEEGVLPLPLRLRLRHVAQDGLAQLLPCERRVSLREAGARQREDGGEEVFHKGRIHAVFLFICPCVYQAHSRGLHCHTFCSSECFYISQEFCQCFFPHLCTN